MKNKPVGLRLGFSLFLWVLIAGCGARGRVRNVAHATAEKEGGKAAKTSEAEIPETEKEAEDAEDGTDSQAPVFGMEDIGNYDGFQYMQKDVLTAYIEEDKGNGRVKRMSVTLYIP